MNVNFEKHKLNVLLKRQGEKFIFEVKSKNEFGEDDDNSSSYEVKGIYHESSSFVERTTSDAAQIRKKKQPMILCSYSDYDKIVIGSKLKIDDKEYEVVEKNDISLMNVYCDVSLELINNE